MAVELYAVAGNALLHFVLLLFVQQLYNDFTLGLRWGFGNRENQNQSPFAQRVQRTIANHIENTVIFAPLAIAVVVAGASTTTTETGALIFLAARIAYAVCYVAGIKVIRSFIWFAGVVGYWMVAWPFVRSLFGAIF